jgi:hypothetical protein
MNRRSAFVCALAGLLVGCGGTVPLLSVVDAQDEGQGDDAQGSSSGGPTDAATGDATADAASDAGGDIAADSAIDATADAQDEVEGVDGAPDASNDVTGLPVTDASADASECSPGAVVCGSGGYQVQCLSDGGWAPYTLGCLCGYLCDSDGGVSCGGNFATCIVNTVQCSGNAVAGCYPYGPGICGVWRVNPACVNQTCVSGTCIGVCSAGSTQCSNGGVQTCTSSGSWGTTVPCEGGTCAGGVCTPSADAAID